MSGAGGFIVLLFLMRALARLFSSSTTPTRRTFNRDVQPWLLVWLVVGPAWVACATGLLATRHWGFGVGLLTSTALLTPWWIARAITIPLGLPRTSTVLAWLSRYHWDTDVGGGIAVAAVLAAARQRQPATTTWRRRWTALLHRPEGDLRWARQRVQRLDLLGAGGVLAAALLADIDDDSAQADRLLKSLEHFDPRVVPAPVRRLAAERRAWRVLRGDDDNKHAPADVRLQKRRHVLAGLDAAGSPTVALLQALLDLDEAPERLTTRWRVRWWWLRAPRRRLTRGFIHVRPAGWPSLQAAQPAVVDDHAATGAAVDASAIDRALHLHVHALRAPPSLERACDVATAWDAGFDSAQQRTRQRATTLGVNGDDAVDDLDNTIQQALRAMVEALDLHDVDAHALPARLGAAVAEMRSHRLDDLETTTAAWRERIDAGVELPPVDELREWTSLVALANDVAKTGSDGRFVAYETLQWCVCERAVRLWNTRNEHRLGNAMFRWLLNEARAVDDTRGIETQTANVACGP
jgi:hypothetical protein